ncbi:hypothetical protein BDY21DRAFT_335226 [Lineolata rhizophorae]|uniref:Uncharacterized protein n=1 Tax=Lineolata rhizophorae TaxID=578093 RepID=A0A6A6P8V2_9PEZI|nr:hypothetical protein BDY21DRAFT_335226 [Lineolata rhizophorae]
MLPPVDPAVFERNPQFKALHQHLCAAKLNPDGTTRDVKRQRAREDLNSRVELRRTETARKELMRQALDSVAMRNVELASELREVIEIISTLLNGNMSKDDREALQGDVEYFAEHIHPIASAMSTYLNTTATDVSIIADPSQPPHPAALPNTIAAMKHTTTMHSSELSQQRVALIDLACQVLSTSREVQESAVRVLEQTIHGSVARNLKTQAEHLEVVAKGVSAKLKIMLATSHPASGPDPEFNAALQNYNAHLLKKLTSLETKEASTHVQLQKYERSGSAGMREITARYVELLGETRRAENEIERLKNGERRLSVLG